MSLDAPCRQLNARASFRVVTDRPERAARVLGPEARRRILGFFSADVRRATAVEWDEGAVRLVVEGEELNEAILDEACSVVRTLASFSERESAYR
jgi:hypothetical protein